MAPTLLPSDGGASNADNFTLVAAVTAEGGNRTSGPIDVTPALLAHGGPNGHQDFESETFIVEVPPVAAPLTAGSHDSHAPGRRQEDDENLVVANTLRSGHHGYDAPRGDGADNLVVAPFDEVQITSRGNRSSVEADAPATTLNGSGRAGVILPAEGAVAYSIYPKGDGTPDIGASKTDVSQAVTANHGTSQNRRGTHVVEPLSKPTDTHDVMGYNSGIGEPTYAATEARSREVLRRMRRALGEEAFQQWGLRVVEHLRQAEVLRSDMHGEELRCPPESVGGLGDNSLPCSQASSAGSVLGLLQVEWPGCPPHRHGSHQQLASELGEALSELPSEAAQSAAFVSTLRQAGEGLRLLLDALSEIQASRRSEQDGDSRSSNVQGVPGASERSGPVRTPLHAAQEERNAASHGGWIVRRLTPKEAERLQGWPDDHTRYRADGREIADGPRYRMIGNGVSSTVAYWLACRMRAVLSEAAS